MTLKDLQKLLVEFRDRRNWKKFHTPKNLAMSVSIESGELLELFQWKSEQEIESAKAAAEFVNAAEDEIADVLIYLVLLAGELGIDPVEAARTKIARNEQRFPPDEEPTDGSFVAPVPLGHFLERGVLRARQQKLQAPTSGLAAEKHRQANVKEVDPAESLEHVIEVSIVKRLKSSVYRTLRHPNHKPPTFHSPRR